MSAVSSRPAFPSAHTGLDRVLAELMAEMVADEAPRLFAVAQEDGERIDGRIAAWGMAFEDHAEIVGVDSGAIMRLRSPERAARHLSRRQNVSARVVWVSPDTAALPMRSTPLRGLMHQTAGQDVQYRDTALTGGTFAKLPGRSAVRSRVAWRSRAARPVMSLMVDVVETSRHWDLEQGAPGGADHDDRNTDCTDCEVVVDLRGDAGLDCAGAVQGHDCGVGFVEAPIELPRLLCAGAHHPAP